MEYVAVVSPWACGPGDPGCPNPLGEANHCRAPVISIYCAERGWQEAMIKPVIAIGHTGLRLVTHDKESLIHGQTHLDASLARGAAMMIQPFLPEGSRA